MTLLNNPTNFVLLALLPGLAAAAPQAGHAGDFAVTAPPAALGLAPFYEKYVDANGYPIRVVGQGLTTYALEGSSLPSSP